jgi:hypothetical protein
MPRKKKETVKPVKYEKFTVKNSNFSARLCELINKYFEWVEMEETRKNRRYFHAIPQIVKYPTAKYYVTVGARSTGKTFEPVALGILSYIAGDGVFAYVRRYDRTITEKNMTALVGGMGKMLEYVTDGEYNKVAWWRGCWWLERWETDEETGTRNRAYRNPIPCGGAWSMNTWENDKGPDFGADKGGFSCILIDEFLSKGANYIPDEWGVVENVISSLIRDNVQKGTKVFMLANPVSKWKNPYFKAMGIKTDIYTEPGVHEIKFPLAEGQKKPMTVIFTYICAVLDRDGETATDVDPTMTDLYNEYFAFPNSKGKSMSITHGIWEMEDAATLPDKYLNDSITVKTVYFKSSEDEFFACDISKFMGTGQYYLYFYDPELIEIPDKHFYFTLLPEMEKYAIIAGGKDGKGNDNKVWARIKMIYNTNRLYYSDLEVADAWHGWIKEASKYIP